MYKFFLWMAKNDSFRVRVVTMCVFHTFICEPLPAAESSFPKLPFNAFAVRMCKCVLYSQRVIAWLWHHFLSFWDTIVPLITFYFIRSLNREHFAYWSSELWQRNESREKNNQTNAFTVTWLRQTDLHVHRTEFSF